MKVQGHSVAIYYPDDVDAPRPDDLAACQDCDWIGQAHEVTVHTDATFEEARNGTTVQVHD